MFTQVLILFAAVYIKLSATKCLEVPSGLYCTNLEKGDDNKLLISLNETERQNDIRVIYIRNSSGIIDSKTFSTFRNVKSLDIQFSSIESFSPESSTVNTLYLMSNSKFPNLTAEFMKQCCRNLSILFIVGNNELKIETGAFKHTTNLTHLTISKQNITSLTKEFFEGLEKLTYLNLKQNGILKIDENAFGNLTKLNHLILSYNNFSKIESNTFQNLTVLEAIEMHGINFTDFNLTIFTNQTELKVIELPTTLIKKKLELSDVIKTFPKLETFGFQNEDREDVVVNEFINKCKASGYHIKFSNIYDL